jgi:hypothetical protein
MRKKLQDAMFETSYIFEFLISLIVGIGILAFGVKMIIDMSDFSIFKDGVNGLMGVLEDAITLAIGAELIKMLCKHTPETIIEVLAFALAKQLIVGHSEPWMNLITVLAIAILFAIRRFLLIRHDMVETPDGLVDKEIVEEGHIEE